MLPVALREPGPQGLDAANEDLARHGLCLVLARLDSASLGLAPALADERAAAARFPEGAEGDRGRGHVLRRRIARSVAGRRLALPAERLTIRADHRGRPEFRLVADRAAGPLPLHVSFSARGPFGLVGIATRPLGVDIEALIRAESLPWNLLRPDEIARLTALAPREREVEFIKLWSIKEAFLKSMGLGLSAPPEQVAVNLESGEKQYSIIFYQDGKNSGEYRKTSASFDLVPDSRGPGKIQYGVAVSLLSN